MCLLDGIKIGLHLASFSLAMLWLYVPVPIELVLFTISCFFIIRNPGICEKLKESSFFS
jgi:hypothetical protein